jgi:hypothetical protein
MRRALTAVLFVLTLGRAAAGQQPAAPPVCGASTSLTLLGIDTRGGEALFALPDGGWIDLRLGDTPTALRIPAEARPLAGASTGPGPLIVVRPCGDTCLQPERLAGGSFQALGEALVAPASATVAVTYDNGGAPWIVLHEPSGSGVLDARAFRLTAGEWQPSGRLRVTDVGNSGAFPISTEKDAITSGTGLFRAGAEAGYWLKGLPDLSPSRRGQVIPLGGASAAVVAADGVVYRSSDRGATWRKALWTPWSATVVQPWTAGKDYESEPPAGDLAFPFPMVWFDRRDPNATEHVVLSTMADTGEWTTVATVPATIERAASEGLEIRDILRLSGNRWALVAGCSDAGEIVLRMTGPGAGGRGASNTILSLPIQRLSQSSPK